MLAYFKTYGLEEVVESGFEPPPLPNNPTMAQIRHHNEEVAKEGKALIIIHSAVNDEVFTRIMACMTAKEAWDKLKEEFHGSSRTRQMQVLNLRREFEGLKMNDVEIVREYSNKLMKVVDQICLLGKELSDQRVVEKVLVSLPEKFESKISSLEDSKDLSQISLSELVNALQATEQRRQFREQTQVEGAFVATNKGKANSSHGRKGYEVNTREKNINGEESSREWENKYGKFPPCPNCKKTNHLEKNCWFKPNIQCRHCKQLGHIEKVCKVRRNQEEQQARVVEETQHEEELFAATCYSANSNGAWLIDSGCTHHMTADLSIFQHIEKSSNSRVKLGNGDYVDVKGKGTIAINTSKGTKLISDVLFVPEINQNLLSVGQMLDRNYVLFFKGKYCTIIDPYGYEFMTIEMKNRSFHWSPPM